MSAYKICKKKKRIPVLRRIECCLFKKFITLMGVGGRPHDATAHKNLVKYSYKRRYDTPIVGGCPKWAFSAL